MRLRECVGVHVCGRGLGEAGGRQRYAHDACMSVICAFLRLAAHAADL